MSFWPELSAAVQHAVQLLYGWILLLVLIHQFVPNWKRFFLSDRWGGYARSGPLADLLLNPFISPLLGIAWASCAVALVSDWHPVVASFANLILCHYFFVASRWRSVLRGFGAPGFMTYWLGSAVFLLALTRCAAPAVQPLAVLFLQVDIALIVFSAGLYKFRSGYARGEGMDYGLVNPMWGYRPKFFRRLPVDRKIFFLFNQSAWVSQLVGAALMLMPATRWLGGGLEIVTYLYIATQIRLGWLAEQMMVVGLLFFCVGTPPGDWFATHWPAPVVFGSPTSSGLVCIAPLLRVFLWFHLSLTMLCHAGLFYNFYGRRRLPFPFQGALETYSNFFGIILWRVFSVDHLNFYVNIYRSSATEDGESARELLSEWQNPFNFRFWHVGEAITVTSLFTTLKYYPSNDALFRDRLIQYGRTLPCARGQELVFEYLCIRKTAGHYEDRLACRYKFDPRVGQIRMEAIDPMCSPKMAHGTSPLHETARPGSYAPKAT